MTLERAADSIHKMYVNGTKYRFRTLFALIHFFPSDFNYKVIFLRIDFLATP